MNTFILLKILTLQCLCTISLNIVIIIHIHLEFYGSLKEKCHSLEMLLINCKIHLELNWTKNCVMSDINGETIFKITNTKLHVSIVT